MRGTALRRAAILTAAMGWANGWAQEPVVTPTVEVEGARERGESGTRPRSTIQREELLRRPAETLGSAIGDSAGVHNASFGPGVGLPVIRGMSGSRVKVAIDGIGTHDASTVSPDHAVSAEALLADEVRVLRGPETIRYGSGAIGGVVEVNDGRIPERLPDRPVTGSVVARYNVNGQGRAAAAKLDLGQDRIACHVDAFARANNNISIPGFAIDEEALLQQFGLRPQTNTFGYVANSDARAYGGTAGGSILFDSGMLGVSVGTSKNNYGIPGGAGAHVDPGQPAVPALVRIDMEQTRTDFKAMLGTSSALLETAEFRAGYVDYRHDELDNGRPATTFSNRALEGRLELTHRLGRRVSGTLGLHGIDRQFAALGAEAFVPASSIQSSGVYLIERVQLGRLHLEGSARQENQRIATQPQNTVFGTVEQYDPTRFRPFSYAASAGVDFDARSGLTLTYSRAQRAPDVQELYSLGPHLATRTFDIGTSINAPALGLVPTPTRLESIEGYDVGVRAGAGLVDARVNLFDYRAANYLYQQNTGAFYDTESQLFLSACVNLEQCLPVYQYAQRDATLRGYEAQLTLSLPEVRSGPMELTLFSDYVRGRFEGGADIPRMSPRRTGAEVTSWIGRWTGRVRFTRVAPQNHPGELETPSKGYDLLNAYLEYRIERAKGREVLLFLNGLNLLDAEIRSATSFLRSFAPERGRSVEIGLRVNF